MSNKPLGYGVPAIHSNMFSITVNDNGQARIVFLDAIEGRDGAAVAHIMMSVSDLTNLVDFGTKVLKRHRARKN